MNPPWKKKGLEVENYVRAAVKELVPPEIGVIQKYEKADFVIGSHTLVEVKSAEVCTSNGKNRPREREGRFWVWPNCHKILCCGGYVHWYALAVTYKGVVVLIRCVPAKAIKLHGNYIRLNTIYSDTSVGIEKMVELALIQEYENKK